MINSSGITIRSLNEIKEIIERDLRGIYGAELILEQDTPDGQRVGLQAKLVADLEEFLLSTYNSFNPNINVGTQLDNIAKINGITRFPARPSTVLISFINPAQLPNTIPEGFKIKDSNGNLWETRGRNNQFGRKVPFYAVDETADFIPLLPAYPTQSGENTNWTRVTPFSSEIILRSSEKSITGNHIETDEDLRVRRERAVGVSGNTTVSAVEAQILSLIGITDVVTIDNDTDAPLNGQTPHSLRIVVQGGSTDLAKTILANKVGGVLLVGNQTEVVDDLGKQRTINYDNARVKEVALTFSVSAAIANDVVGAALRALRYKMGEFLDLNTLYEVIYDASPESFVVSNLMARVGADSPVSTGISAEIDEFVRITGVTITQS